MAGAALKSISATNAGTTSAGYFVHLPPPRARSWSAPRRKGNMAGDVIKSRSENPEFTNQDVCHARESDCDLSQLGSTHFRSCHAGFRPGNLRRRVDWEVGPRHYCKDMLTQAPHRLGIAVMGSPHPHVQSQTDERKLMSRSSAELDMAAGSAVLILVGFVLIWALGLLAEWIWKSKAGAGAGGLVCAVGLTGYLLHYARSRFLESPTPRTPRARESVKE